MFATPFTSGRYVSETIAIVPLLLGVALTCWLLWIGVFSMSLRCLSALLSKEWRSKMTVTRQLDDSSVNSFPFRVQKNSVFEGCFRWIACKQEMFDWCHIPAIVMYVEGMHEHEVSEGFLSPA